MTEAPVTGEEIFHETTLRGASRDGNISLAHRQTKLANAHAHPNIGTIERRVVQMDVGVVGIGPMGGAMARSLLRAGHKVTVFNRTRERAEALRGDGATIAGTAAEAAAREAVITMLATDDAVENLVFGADGVLAGLPKGAIHISGSTISVDLSQRLEEAHHGLGQGFIAAPVLGRPPAAEAGKLFVMAAGEAALIERVKPVLEALGQRLFIVGERPFKANLVKLSCNFMIFSTIEQMAEIFALNQKGGVDKATLYEVLTESFFSAPVHKNYGRMILDQSYDPPGTPLGLGAKDTRLILEAAEALTVPLPFASILRDRFLASVARGDGGLDFSAIAKRSAEDAGL
ncbi:NAD(P)-dependent oxidoreductase [Acidisoma sp.]|uniref:NAD(P)-dependent oxidoreductase n=1 Tax=Acidisoma sp. TaxID=1872115 RepID=UPI003AFFE3AA